MEKQSFLYKAFLSITITHIVSIMLVLLRVRVGIKESVSQADQRLRLLARNKGKEYKHPNQLDKIRKKASLRIAVVGNKAYWVHDNVFYQGSIVNGAIDNSKAVPVDAHKLSERELKDLLDILDSIYK